jgi:peroxiredoxin
VAGVGGDHGREAAERDADDAAHEGERGRFEQELDGDVPTPRADCPAEAYFSAPLQDRDDHDVGDTDSANQQRDRSQPDEGRLGGDARDVTLVAVSPQAPDGALSMTEKNHLAYPVVSDPGSSIARQLGILTAPSPEARTAQLQLGLDLTAVNADATTTLPMPTAVILDAEHVLRWIDVHPDYSTRTEAQQILDALDQLAL